MADLTRAAVLALPAGPALDALVAERVLGWTRSTDPRCLGWWNDPTDLGRPVSPNWLPAYSTDIAAAWAVVEHMRARGFHPLIGYCEQVHDTPMPEVQFVHDSGSPDGYVNCDCNPCASMPHAIVVAALLATREEDRTDG